MEVFKCKEFTFASEWLRRKGLSTSVLSLLPLLSKTIHHHPKPIFKSLGSNGDGISMGGGGGGRDMIKLIKHINFTLLLNL